MHEHREVRVTARESVKTPFVAPELSAPRLVDLEAEKGLKGWTDFDTKVPDLRGDHLPKGLVESRIEAIKVGTVIRKTPAARNVRVVSPTGPNAYHKAMRERAARLAAR
ncbi:hypothetical protein PBI_CHE12_101 [Mycobacterium phage Che12]|uniref:Uncharacterized protein n=1 Tax=Mycobacterium phage Che12 TaxID=2911435 RepID=Q1A0B6_9CAUD|nr:gp101 [Mycobacterium phage Che12]ABE67420.1 hypothetical protein PBI_CHE12_101 [Mycobacterium phage Che12]